MGQEELLCETESRTTSTFVAVADGARARFFLVKLPEHEPHAICNLTEQEPLRIHGRDPRAHSKAVPDPPVCVQWDFRWLELERRFAAEIVRRIATEAARNKVKVVILVAEPRMLGFLHENVRAALAAEVKLKELARDYTARATEVLAQVLELAGMPRK